MGNVSPGPQLAKQQTPSLTAGNGRRGRTRGLPFLGAAMTCPVFQPQGGLQGSRCILHGAWISSDLCPGTPPLFLLGKEEPHHGDFQPQPGCSPLPSAEAHSGKWVTQANALPVRMCWASRVAVVAQEGTPSCPEVFRPRSGRPLFGSPS